MTQTEKRPEPPSSRGAPSCPVGNGPVLIFGGGKSGHAALKLLATLKIPVVLYDDRGFGPPADDAGVARLVETATRYEKSLPDSALEGVTCCVVSPGVPPSNATLQKVLKAGIEVISEIELGSRYASVPVIAVTGSNAKTTTVSMIEALLQAAGLKAISSGNIGFPFTTAVLERPEVDWYVVEVSSFQLHFVNRFRTRVALITSFSPNHLDWHGGEEAYLDDKLKIADSVGDGGSVIYSSESPQLEARLEGRPGCLVSAGDGGDVSLDESTLVLSSRSRGRSLDLSPAAATVPFDLRQIKTALIMSYAVLCELDLEDRHFLSTIASFRPLAHRLEPVGEKEGVLYINDSKATSTDAARYALARQVRPVILLLGGRDKGLDFTELLHGFESRVKAVVAYGEAGSKIEGQLRNKAEVERTNRLEDALEAARKRASRGDVILLSPACASFDQFANYEERGERFRTLVAAIGSAGPATETRERTES